MRRRARASARSAAGRPAARVFRTGSRVVARGAFCGGSRPPRANQNRAMYAHVTPPPAVPQGENARNRYILYVKESKSDIPPISGWNIPHPTKPLGTKAVPVKKPANKGKKKAGAKELLPNIRICNFKSEEYAKFKAKADKKIALLRQQEADAEAAKGESRRRGSQFYMDELKLKTEMSMKKRQEKNSSPAVEVPRNQSLVQHMRAVKSQSAEDGEPKKDSPYMLERGKTAWEVKRKSCSVELKMTLRGAMLQTTSGKAKAYLIKKDGASLPGAALNDKLAGSFKQGWGLMDSKVDLGKMYNMQEGLRQWNPIEPPMVNSLDRDNWFLKGDIVARHRLRRNNLVLQALERCVRRKLL